MQMMMMVAVLPDVMLVMPTKSDTVDVLYCWVVDMMMVACSFDYENMLL